MFVTVSWLRTGLIWPALLAVLAACATVPTQELSDAHQAIQAAEQAGAAQRVANQLLQARQQLKQAQQAAGDGHYEQARLAALDAKQTAVQSRQLAVLVSGGEAAVQEARVLGVARRGTEDLLLQGMQAAEQGDVPRAEALLSRVRQQAALASNQYYLGEAQRQLEELAALPIDTQPAWRARMEKARAAYGAGDGRAAYEQSQRLLREIDSE